MPWSCSSRSSPESPLVFLFFFSLCLKKRDRGPEKESAAVRRLVELNVEAQVFNVVSSPVVQAAWARGQQLVVHGLVYTPGTGRVKVRLEPGDLSKNKAVIDMPCGRGLLGFDFGVSLLAGQGCKSVLKETVCLGEGK